MTRKRLLIYALALASFTGGLTTGCSSFLDADNKSNVTTDAYYRTEEGYASLVNATYSTLRSLYGGEPKLFCCGTDLYMDGRNKMDDFLHGYKLDANNDDVKSFYQNCYAGIQLANEALYYRDLTVQTDQVPGYCDQVRFLRAYYYYLLSQHFGGVPIETDYIQNARNDFPRATLAETYQFIIGELTDLEQNGNLPETDYTGRISKQAVRAILAKTYLAAGWDLGTTSNEDGSNVSVTDKTYFGLAASMADKAIAGKPLTMTFEQKWAPTNDNNEETIFTIQYDRGTAESSTDGNSQQNYFGSTYGTPGTDGHKGSASSYAPTIKLLTLYQKGDDRYDGTFMKVLYEYDPDNTEYRTGYYAFYGDHTADIEIKMYYPPHYACSKDEVDAWRAEDPVHRTNTRVVPMTDPTYNPIVLEWSDDSRMSYAEAVKESCGGTCIRKFDDPESVGNTSESFRDIVVTHLSDMYLVAAEAYYMDGDLGTALSRINEVRGRAHAALLQQQDLDVDAILDERAMELAGEYQRWMDLRRTRKLVEYNLEWNTTLNGRIENMRGTDGKIKWYRPIPQDEINLNEAMTEADQNDGYK